MLSRARRGVCEIVAGAALWRCRCEIVAGAALWRCRCRSRGRRSILCIWVLCNCTHTRGARYMCVDIWEKHSMWGHPIRSFNYGVSGSGVSGASASGASGASASGASGASASGQGLQASTRRRVHATLPSASGTSSRMASMVKTCCPGRRRSRSLRVQAAPRGRSSVTAASALGARGSSTPGRR